MSTLKEIFDANYQWFFSGIGVAAISAVFAIFGIILRFRKRKGDINISTKGNKSPGFVGRDYKVGKDD